MKMPLICVAFDSVDPNGILSFIVAQLQAAEDAGQRAWIIGHIPAGKADIFHDQVRVLLWQLYFSVYAWSK
jgi:hypothetical protein